MKIKFRKVARGIFIKNNKILLAKSYRKNNFHLPGGGVYKCESAASALLREIKEELNMVAIIVDLLGIIENNWNENGNFFYETNFLFKVNILGNDDKSFSSNEENLSFDWISLSDINTVNIKPVCVTKLLNKICNGHIKVF